MSFFLSQSCQTAKNYNFKSSFGVKKSFLFSFCRSQNAKSCRNEQNQSRKIFLVSILSTTRNGFSLFSSCQREFILFFLVFLSCRNAISARKRANSLDSKVDFRSFQLLSIKVEKLKVEFFP
jgi:hypothetical protein